MSELPPTCSAPTNLVGRRHRRRNPRLSMELRSLFRLYLEETLKRDSKFLPEAAFDVWFVPATVIASFNCDLLPNSGSVRWRQSKSSERDAQAAAK